MAEQEENNLSTEEFDEAELEDDFIPADAQPVCPKCFEPCNRLQYYCDKCSSGDAINPLTPYMPFMNIRFNYDIFLTMWRKTWYDKYISMGKRLFYLLMITMLAPLLLVVGIPLLIAFGINNSKLRKITVIILIAIAIVLFALFLRLHLFTGMVTHPIRNPIPIR